jgi:hypothetical protein
MDKSPSSCMLPRRLRRSVNNLHLPPLSDQITHLVHGDVRIPLRIAEAPVRILSWDYFSAIPSPSRGWFRVMTQRNIDRAIFLSDHAATSLVIFFIILISMLDASLDLEQNIGIGQFMLHRTIFS